jgi:uncharacterized membrane protein
MNPSQLSEQLRKESTPDLNRRRWIVGLSLVGIAVSKIVTLYQMGIVKKLPDPPISLFDSSKVDASDYAYKRLDTPDALMMLTNYGITAWLAGAGGKDRARQTPLLSIAMGTKVLMDTAGAIMLGWEEWKENKKLCFYCQIATLASATSLALAIPEVLTALKQIRAGKSDNNHDFEQHVFSGRTNLVPSGTP